MTIVLEEFESRYKQFLENNPDISERLHFFLKPGFSNRFPNLTKLIKVLTGKLAWIDYNPEEPVNVYPEFLALCSVIPINEELEYGQPHLPLLSFIAAIYPHVLKHLRYLIKARQCQSIYLEVLEPENLMLSQSNQSYGYYKNHTICLIAGIFEESLKHSLADPSINGDGDTSHNLIQYFIEKIVNNAMNYSISLLMEPRHYLLFVMAALPYDKTHSFCVKTILNAFDRAEGEELNEVFTVCRQLFQTCDMSVFASLVNLIDQRQRVHLLSFLYFSGLNDDYFKLLHQKLIDCLSVENVSEELKKNPQNYYNKLKLDNKKVKLIFSIAENYTHQKMSYECLKESIITDLSITKDKLTPVKKNISMSFNLESLLLHVNETDYSPLLNFKQLYKDNPELFDLCLKHFYEKDNPESIYKVLIEKRILYYKSTIINKLSSRDDLNEIPFESLEIKLFVFEMTSSIFKYFSKEKKPNVQEYYLTMLFFLSLKKNESSLGQYQDFTDAMRSIKKVFNFLGPSVFILFHAVITYQPQAFIFLLQKLNKLYLNIFKHNPAEKNSFKSIVSVLKFYDLEPNNSLRLEVIFNCILMASKQLLDQKNYPQIALHVIFLIEINKQQNHLTPSQINLLCEILNQYLSDSSLISEKDFLDADTSDAKDVMEQLLVKGKVLLNKKNYKWFDLLIQLSIIALRKDIVSDRYKQLFAIFFQRDLNLKEIIFMDGGDSVCDWIPFAKSVFSILPEPAIEDKTFPLADEIIDLLENKKDDEFTIESEVFSDLVFERILGRTIICINSIGHRIAFKIQKEDESTKTLKKEYYSLCVLNAKKAALGLKSYIPTPLKLLQLSHQSLMIWLSKQTNLDTQSLINSIGHAPYHGVLCYQVDSQYADYFTYLHDPALPFSQFVMANRRAVHDLCRLMGEGILFHQLADLFHNSEKNHEARSEGGRYTVLIDLILNQLNYKGSGRLTGWKKSVRYPNLRGTGLADLGDWFRMNQIYTLDDIQLIFKKYLVYVEENFGTAAPNYVMANLLTEYQYVLFLIIGVRAVLLEKKANKAEEIEFIWHSSAMLVISNCAQMLGNLTTYSENEAKKLLCQSIKPHHLARQMQYFMTNEYVAHTKQLFIKPDVFSKKVDADICFGEFRRGTFDEKIGNSINGIDEDLGNINGQEPIKEANKLFYKMTSLLALSFLNIPIVPSEEPSPNKKRSRGSFFDSKVKVKKIFENSDITNSFIPK